MDIKLLLTQLIATEAGLPVEEISGDEKFESFHLDSLSLISLAFEVENITGIEQIDPTIFTEYDTINKLTAWVESQK
ncbi:acyl carrier protein [Mucilaginibacter sp. Bleaf8]|uniref:acyl carrier protein n=1 Tax=Mucilaginibacter sp. Bleaf8 TaxID=2834430 RepID=UPI001BCE2E3F|nr:acyl carrier protein [Mucilaginibacter sp. Bleaf8]MBS7562915.1 acyl carrier protein [Mucilaginibacter sp. Bleaf8]